MFEEIIDKFDDLKDDNPLLAYFIAGFITVTIIYLLFKISILGLIVLGIVVLMVIGWVISMLIDILFY